MPYRIRAAGLDRDLSSLEFGRALYHLAQRRGFLSNRKSKEKADEKSVVKQGISDLAKEMGSLTLGQYFASIDPEKVKLRRRWTSRAMYRDEFEQLWARQSGPLKLNDNHRQSIHDAIFFQRPLKSSAHLIGRCRHLTQYKRAPLACRLAQQFRLLQKVNDLFLVDSLHNRIPLDPDQRAIILDHLSRAESVKMTQLRKLINAPKSLKFNFETEGESSLPGHRTDNRLAQVIPDYHDWSEPRKTSLVDELLGEMEDDKLVARVAEAYKLSPEVASAVVDVALEALRRLLPRMVQGENYMLVARDIFPKLKPAKPLDRLPPVLKHNPDLRNPTVLRGLTEVRKLVNLIVKRFGKPVRIHIELLRDLKNSRDARADISKKNDDRRKLRERAAQEIVKQAKFPRASARDVEKWLLAEECHWTCPYTGKPIKVHNLFTEPQFEIEHTWPYAQSLDDSFANKTLCHVDANRTKGNRLPAQAFSESQLKEILDRVSRFDGDLREVKLQRFKATQIPEGFTNRQLTDSSHLARAASQYLTLLYGDINDADGNKRIHTRIGSITAQLRRLWGLNEILSGTDEKTREDHRHHAVDAVVVGCCDTRTVQVMMREASLEASRGRSRLRDLPTPWESFKQQLSESVDAIVVSHRQSRNIGGKLHAESNYSREKQLVKGEEPRRTIRKPVTSLKDKDFDRIVDVRIRNAVEAAFAASGAKSPDKAFADGKFPQWLDKSGKAQVIKRVTLETDVTNPKIMGKAERTRYVESTQGSNHHARIIAKLNTDGTEKSWYDDIVTRIDMHQRKAQGKIGADTTVGKNEKFVFSLAANEYVEIDDLDDSGKPIGRMLCRVLSVSKGDFELIHHLDGRTSTQRKEAGRIRAKTAGPWLQKRNAVKKFVNYLGEVKNAGG
jgi:CRISPR-associated endonuclease Csn1